jgi:hypothetical protein
MYRRRVGRDKDRRLAELSCSAVAPVSRGGIHQPMNAAPHEFRQRIPIAPMNFFQLLEGAFNDDQPSSLHVSVEQK